MNNRLANCARRLGCAVTALLLATALSVAPAAAQKKPDFAGKGANEAEKGERGRSDAAKDMARERGEGEKKGLYKEEDKEKEERDKDAAKADDGKAKSDDHDKKSKKNKGKGRDHGKGKD